MQGLQKRGVPIGFDRRRTPRYDCVGDAEIRCVPWNGMLLAGRLRNLGLGGCYIATVSPLQFGAQTEILLRVSDACFRTLGLVKGTHNRAGIAVQFLRMSARGQAVLEDLLFELTRRRVAMRAVRLAARGKMPRNTEDLATGAPSIVLADRVPMGTVLPTRTESRALEERASSSDTDLLTPILDLFA